MLSHRFEKVNLLRVFVGSLAVFGIIGHTVGVMSFLYWKPRNFFGIDVVSPLVRVAMSRYVTFTQQMTIQPYLKVGVDGTGIFMSFLLLFGAMKRCQIPYFIYILYAALYLFCLVMYSLILGRLWVWGMEIKFMRNEIIPAVVTAVLLILGLVNAVASLVQYRRGIREANFFSTGGENNSSSDKHESRNSIIFI